MDYTPKKTDKNNSILICDGAYVVGNVTLGKGVSVWYNATIRGDGGDISIGENTNVQDGAVIHAETVVGANCTIGHNAIVHGCTIGDNVLVGAGAKVLGPIVIDSNSKIAANAVVLKDIPENSTAVGIPARIARQGGRKVDDLDQIHIPDPVAQEISKLEARINELSQEIDLLKANKKR